MKQYVLRVRVAETFADVAFTAIDVAGAIRLAEAQFGHGCFLNVISEG